MWSNVISIDKGEENKFKRLVRAVDGIKELSTAVEESGNRRFLYMAGLCDYADTIRDRVERILSELFLTDYKLAFYMDRINCGGLSYPAISLLSTLVYLDYDLEKAFVINVLRELSSYDIDAIFRFRLKALRASWLEIAEMCNRLFAIGTDDTDIYNVISYITATKTQKPVNLALTGKDAVKLINIDSGENVNIVGAYGIFEYDLINAVIAANATRLTIDNVELDKEAVRALKRIVRVKIN